MVQLFEFKKSKIAVGGHFGCPKMAITSEPVCPSMCCLVLAYGFRLSLDLFLKALHTRIAVAHNPCGSWAFLLNFGALSNILHYITHSALCPTISFVHTTLSYQYDCISNPFAEVEIIQSVMIESEDYQSSSGLSYVPQLHSLKHSVS